MPCIGEHFREAYVFGSYARLEAEEESDLDVLVVLQDFDRYVAEIERTSRLVSDLSLEAGVTVSPVFVRQSEWAAGGSSFLDIVRAEAITV